jgi:hypothetical protein
MDLCTLAAALTNGQPVHSGNARDLIAQADALWKASGKWMDEKGRFDRMMAERMARDAETAVVVPEAKSYPVFLPEILRLIVTSKKTETNRMTEFRAFIRERIPWDQAIKAGGRPSLDLPPATEDEVNAELSRLKTEGLSRGAYLMMADSYGHWAAATMKRRFADRAKTAAVARHKKSKKVI